MKRQKLTVLAIAAGVMALGLLGCSDSAGGGGGTTPAYGISLSQTEVYTFTAATTGYSAQTAHNVIITNTGSQATGALTVALSGDNSASFTLSATSVNSIGVGSSGTFTVVPNNGLTAATYTATVTVSGDNIAAKSFDVSFTVNSGTDVAGYGISLSETGTYTFTAATVGYSAQTAHSVTITNTGNQATGALSVALSGDNSASFTLSAISVNSIGVGSSGTFTVVPQNGLTATTYTATVTVSGDNIAAKSFGVSFTVNPVVSGTALWARSVSAGADRSSFNSVAVDSSGNMYAAGYQTGTGSFTYGSGVSAQGTSSGSNVVLVKYNADGTALWANSVSSGSGGSQFDSVAVDSAGNVYAAGIQSGTGSFTYGTGVTAQGTYSINAVLVKYNADGTAQWARSVSTGSASSGFSSVAVDSSGNVYAAGIQSDTGSFTYGTGVTAQGTYSTNAVLVKYNADGTALWANSVSVGAGESMFNSVAADSSGNVYAAGVQEGTGSFEYGSGVTVQGASDINAVLVKYNSTGTAQWAKSISGSGYSQFNSVSVDSADNVYAAGVQQEANGEEAVLVKYNAAGTAQWAKSVSGSSYSWFNSVAVDGAGNVYAAGGQDGTGSYTYDPGITVAGTASNNNLVLVKYNAGGTAQWAKSVSAGAARSQFSSVAADSAGNVYAAGLQSGTGSYTYGSGVSVAGTATGSNVVLVKYKEE